ncbi:hypothetical protein RJ640_009988 [Escallonia rubra]|uniref:Uncharacterized protein n=1 Tax=Escallonia rubra TaxID=112253 RepID=A0AA88R189_9ASTE|nr:hypothetical protein RJ640_009988 [Escallonia rubra]
MIRKMQAIPRWRNALLLKDSFIQSASIHSTPTCLEKWKSKWKWTSDTKGPQPSKSYIRYETRQKRADAKKALNDLLHNNGSLNNRSSRFIYEEEFSRADKTSRQDDEQANHSESANKKCRSKSSARRVRHQKMKRKHRADNFFDEFDEDPGTFFQARFGNRLYMWSSFKLWEESSFQNSTNGFDWREHANWTNRRSKKWGTASEGELDDESCFTGSYSERALLGLPTKGPLKIEDVKNA